MLAGRYDRQTVIGRVIAADAAAADALADGVRLRRVMAAAAVMQLLLAVVRENFVRPGAHAVRVTRASGPDDRCTVVVRPHARRRIPAAAAVIRRGRLRGRRHGRIAHFQPGRVVVVYQVQSSHVIRPRGRDRPVNAGLQVRIVVVFDHGRYVQGRVGFAAPDHEPSTPSAVHGHHRRGVGRLAHAVAATVRARFRVGRIS